MSDSTAPGFGVAVVVNADAADFDAAVDTPNSYACAVDLWLIFVMLLILILMLEDRQLMFQFDAYCSLVLAV